MKKIAFVAIVLASSTAFAQNLGDLNFFQKQGSFYYQGSVASSTYTTVQKSNNTKYEQEGMILKNQLSYGVANNLNVFAEINYKFENNLRINNSADHQDNGLTNPGVGANYRLMTGPVFVDIFGKLNGRLTDAEKGSGRKDGNGADAADFSGQIGAAVGKKISEFHEVRFTASAKHSTDGEYTNRTSPEAKVKTDSKTDFFFTANYQYRPVETFMFDFGYVASLYGETTEKTGGSKNKFDSRLDHLLALKAKYQITDSLLATVFINEALYLPDYDGKTGAANDEIKRRKYSDFGVAVDFLF